MSHAFSSPSAASRTENCAAAPQRCDMTQRRNQFVLNYVAYQKPQLKALFEEDNKAADHGTFLHDQQEQLLKHGIPLDAIEDPFERDGVQRICDDILAEQNDAIDHGVETKLFNDGVDSFGSSDAWALNDGNIKSLELPDGTEYTGKWLHNRDLKTGRNEVVAEGNSQGLRYTCGLMEHFGWDEEIEYVKITIDAFRFPSSSWIISRDELMDYWLNTFRPAMYENNQLNPTATPGDHCQYCDARPHCAEFIDHVGGDMPEEIFTNDFSELDISVLEEVYSKATLLKNVTDNLKAELILRQEAAEFTGGEGLTKYKPKAGSMRKYYQRGTDDQIEALLKEAGKLEAAQETKLRSASSVLKLVADDEQLAAKLDKFVVKSQNKPSLVKK